MDCARISRRMALEGESLQGAWAALPAPGHLDLALAAAFWLEKACGGLGWAQRCARQEAELLDEWEAMESASPELADLAQAQARAFWQAADDRILAQSAQEPGCYGDRLDEFCRARHAHWAARGMAELGSDYEEAAEMWRDFFENERWRAKVTEEGLAFLPGLSKERFRALVQKVELLLACGDKGTPGRKPGI